jgi:hypothetical protein
MGKVMRRALVLGGALTALVATQVFGSTNLGETFTPTEDFGGDGVFVQTESASANYTMPSDGVITSWRFEAADGPTPPIKLTIVRSAGGLDYTTVGQSPLEPVVPSTLNNYGTRVPVKTGDLLGIYYSDTTFGFDSPGAGYKAVFRATDNEDNDPEPGVTATYEPDEGNRIDLAATLEPDADRDGYGDETQDCAAQDPARTTDCDPPQGRLTKTPPNRLDRSTAKFKFTSDEAGSTFKCKIDKKPYRSCTSPKKVKRLDEGRHKFKVRATDAAGNTDPTAAKDRFKVVD